MILLKNGEKMAKKWRLFDLKFLPGHVAEAQDDSEDDDDEEDRQRDVDQVEEALQSWNQGDQMSLRKNRPYVL
jgi:hypothetical protein